MPGRHRALALLVGVALARAALALAGCSDVNPWPPVWGAGEHPTDEASDGGAPDAEGGAS
jgi:hypothetical protein